MVRYSGLNHSISPNDVSLLISEDKYALLNDAEAYEIVETLHAPVQGVGEFPGEGALYDPEFFTSFIEEIKRYPIPGNKHDHSSSADADFFTIGGDVKPNPNGGADVHFRIIIPGKDYNGNDNSGFIRAVKLGAVEFSLVSAAEGKRDSCGIMHYTRHSGKARNDVVDEGAMLQNVVANSKENEDEIMRLIKIGAIDYTSESEQLVVNGKVSRRAAIKLQSSADKKALAGRILNAIAEKKKRRSGMEYEEIVRAIKAGIANNTINIDQLMSDISQSNKLRNEVDINNAEAIAKLRH